MSTQYTLFLWPQGLFPRRVSYLLLLKSIVTSPAQLFKGETNIPQLKLNMVTINEKTYAFETANPDDPKPEGFSLPCLRVVNSDGNITWIHESLAIMQFLDELFPGPALETGSALQRAQAHDLELVLNDTMTWSLVYGRHASRTASSWSGLADEKRNHDAALDGYAQMQKCLGKLQRWAIEAGGLCDQHPWIAPPGTSEIGLGLVDLAFAAFVRYMWLTMEWDCLREDDFQPLRDWWAAFTKFDWWKEYERQDEGSPCMHPKMLCHGKADLEV